MDNQIQQLVNDCQHLQVIGQQKTKPITRQITTEDVETLQQNNKQIKVDEKYTNRMIQIEKRLSNNQQKKKSILDCQKQKKELNKIQSQQSLNIGNNQKEQLQKQKSSIQKENNNQKQINTKQNNGNDNQNIQDQEKTKLLNFYKYNLSTLIANCGKLNYYLKNPTFNQKKQQDQIKFKSMDQLYQKLLKVMQQKSKYKYVPKKDHYKMSQMLKYNNIDLVQLMSKQSLKEKENIEKDSSDELDSDEELENRDHLKNKDKKDKDKKYEFKTSKLEYQEYKRKKNIDQKMYIVVGGYLAIQEALQKRGWIEQTDCESLYFDLKWTCKCTDIDHYQLRNYQMANHFENNKHITCKVHLGRNLKNLINQQNTDISTFFPRCYDLEDQQDYDDFIENFKITHCQAMIQQNYQTFKESIQNGNEQSISLYKEIQLTICINVIQKTINKDIIEIVQQIYCNNELPIVNDQEWIIIDRKQIDDNDIDQLVLKYIDTNLDRKTRIQNIVQNMQNIIQFNKQNNSQYELDGNRNIWVLKPGGLSRGRGIKNFNSLQQIVQHIETKKHLKITWIIQKYIENQMIIMNRKFDIRQWVLVTNWNPLEIWFYSESYIRFCSSDFSLEKLNSKYAHLCNNSVNKVKSDTEQMIEGNMWFQDQFSQYLDTNYHKSAYYDNMVPQLKQQVKQSLQAVVENVTTKQNCFELYGYDFLVDTSLKPWLIECNSSPAMDYSTHVTQHLVPQVSEDIMKVVIDYRYNKKADTGKFILL